MARPGPPPDPRSVNRNPRAEWDEVLDVPFDFRAAGRELPGTRTWHPDTVRWYEGVAALPHAVRWRDSDWTALFDLALLKQAQYSGIARATELTEIRHREAIFGTTVESRVKLRIRYTAPTGAPETTEAPDPQVEGSAVTPISSARDRLRRRA